MKRLKNFIFKYSMVIFVIITITGVIIFAVMREFRSPVKPNIPKEPATTIFFE
jgi:hypothetical protein